jgi:diguanylate cyclase (GGDEF)-like protein/PAS domain S-box-containing protein
VGNFFQQHLDYLLFVYGLAFVLIAAICAVIPKDSARGAPWMWLGLFGLTHGFSEWLELLEIDLGATPALTAVRFAVMALSFLFLCEFGRRSLDNSQRRGPGTWIFELLLVLAASGALVGTASLFATTRYALALAGGLWAAWAMYQMDLNDERSRARLAVASVGLAGYAVVAGAVVSRAPFFPASEVNAEWFLSAVGVPIQLFRCAFGVLIATALWSYSARLRKIDLWGAEDKGTAPLGYGLAVMLAVTLVVGWWFAEFASEWSDDQVRELLQVQAGTAAGGFDAGRLASLSGTSADWNGADYERLREQMWIVSRSNMKLRSEHLLVLRGGKVIEAVTVDPKFPDGRRSAVLERPPRELLDAFSTGKVTTLGPYNGGGAGDVASRDIGSAFAPIRDSRTNAVVGILGIDIGADDWKHSVVEYRLTAIFVTLLIALLIMYLFIVRERMWRLSQLTARSESRLVAAQRIAQIGSWSYDHWSRRMVWSEELLHIYGLDPSVEATPELKQLRALTHPQDWLRLRTAMQKAVEDGAGYRLEYRLLRPDGSLRHVEATAHVSRGDSGEVVALTGTVQDITERVRAEKALVDGAAQLRMFAENVPALAVSWDENLRCRFANSAYVEFFGLIDKEIIGKTVREVLGEAVYRDIEGQFMQVLQGRPVTYERTHALPSGESRYLEVKLLPQTGDQGRVLGCFAVTTDITEHKLAEERIQHVAYHDSLTGLPNRRLFNDRLSQAISLAKRHSSQFALLFFDLDRFKSVNDTLGHSAGDELLIAVAARIRHQLRESDTVARVGGDEFLVILPDIDRREDAETVVAKIIATLAKPFQLDGQKRDVDIGTSVGIALYPADAQGADALVQAADAAMYRAKEAGGGFQFFAM